MKIYTAAEMREHEQMAVDKGTTFEQLMENAGRAAAAAAAKAAPGRAGADCVRQRQQRRRRPGDGADTAGARLAGGHPVCRRRKTIRTGGIKPQQAARFGRHRLDCRRRLGRPSENGLRRDYRRHLRHRLQRQAARRHRSNLPPAESIRRLKVALDIPTGLNCDTGEADADTFRADLTYTFAAYKPAHLGGNSKTYCGEIVCLDIGID